MNIFQRKRKAMFKGHLENAIGETVTLTQSNGDVLRDYKIYGNSIQNGTPTPETPVEVLSLGENSRNLLSSNISDYYQEASYSTYKVGELGEYYYTKLIDNDTTVDISGIYVLLFDNLTYASSEFRYPMIANGEISNSEFVSNLYNYLGIYPNTQEAFDKVFQRFKIQVEKGQTSTEYRPYRYIDITSHGKNLVNAYEAYSDTTNFTIENGVISGLLNVFGSAHIKFPEVNKTYTISLSAKFDGTGTPYMYANINGSYTRATSLNYSDWTRVYASYTPVTENDFFVISYGAGGKYTLNIKEIQLEAGLEATDYQPYYNPIIQTINLSGHEPLRKLNGYADYIDYKNKKIVRYIGKIESYNGETINTDWISTTGELSNGATVYYILETPIEESFEDLPEIKTEEYTNIITIYSGDDSYNQFQTSDEQDFYTSDNELFILRDSVGGVVFSSNQQIQYYQK